MVQRRKRGRVKLLEFKRVKDTDNKYGIDPNGECDWFVQLETQKERELYERQWAISEDSRALQQAYEDWEAMLKIQLGVTEDDIFGYFMENETPPKIGEQYKNDGLIFERIN